MTTNQQPDLYDGDQSELGDYLRECVKILPEAIEEEFVRIPADLAYWNAQYARAMREHLTSKIEFEQLEANLRIEVRQALIDNGSKPTESTVEAHVAQSKEYGQAKQRVVDAEVRKAELYGVLDAVRSKKEMLISLGAHLRAEMGHDPMIREKVAGGRLMRDQGG